MKTPASLKVHEQDFHPGAWELFTVAELGQWVHLLLKRATHRKNLEKKLKDIADAQNYLNMIQEHIDTTKKHTEILIRAECTTARP